MKIAIIDADLIGRKRHRFPNLACMKLSGFHRKCGDTVQLKMDYEDLERYDRVCLSKVFTDTPVPEGILDKPNVVYGGTGFFYDRAASLPDAVEHHMPDYHLYDGWVEGQLAVGRPRNEFKYYLDYSIGFLTRGCFRKCAFCVNRNYDHAFAHSPLPEFLDPSRPKICLLDDNFFACPRWKPLLMELKETGRPFQFKQGLDERILTDARCALLFSSRYDGDYIFAFDNVADADLIEKKIRMVRKYSDAVLKFYCFTGFDRNDRWDTEFWEQDIKDLFTRITILMRNNCIPYVMRFARYQESPYRGLYISITRWCNQPAFFKKKTLREYGQLNGENSSCMRYILDYERNHPEMSRFLDMRYGSEVEEKYEDKTTDPGQPVFGLRGL